MLRTLAVFFLCIGIVKLIIALVIRNREKRDA